jgi:hypothetical protein
VNRQAGKSDFLQEPIQFDGPVFSDKVIKLPPSCLFSFDLVYDFFSYQKFSKFLMTPTSFGRFLETEVTLIAFVYLTFYTPGHVFQLKR